MDQFRNEQNDINFVIKPFIRLNKVDRLKKPWRCK